MRKFNKDLTPKPKSLEFNYPSIPLDVEVGCGVGLHPIQYSQKNPNRFLVAIEHTKEKFDKFLRRFTSHNSPSNLLPLHENGISWISHVLKSESVDRFFFLYPNPNPKPSQQNKRFHAMPFMSQVIECLKVGGTIHFATNEEFYAKECQEFMKETWKLEEIEYRTISSEDDFLGRTHFERKYLEKGQSIYNLVYKKN
jgi:tRNA G46 methylase TrmB